MPRRETEKKTVRQLLWQGVRLAFRTTLTIAVAAGALFAVQQGSLGLAKRADAAEAPPPAPTIPVSTRPAVIEPGYEVTRAFIGQVEPLKTAALSFELGGRLAQIRVDEGDAVEAGQVLATQDTALLRAEIDRLSASQTATEARLRFALQTVERRESLTDRGFTSQEGLDQAMANADELRARIAETEAARAAVEIQLEKTQVIAPFTGRVTRRLVDGNETLGAGQTILEIVETGAPRIRIGVPLDLDMADLTVAQIELEGQVLPARLVTLRPDIDPVTRTRTAIFEIDGSVQPAFGQTARLLTKRMVEAPGLWVPITSLKEGTRGQWSVLVVDAEDTVRAMAVHVLHAEADQVFVQGGVPEGTRLIDKGPQRVTVGQRVRAPDTM